MTALPPKLPTDARIEKAYQEAKETLFNVFEAEWQHGSSTDAAARRWFSGTHMLFQPEHMENLPGYLAFENELLAAYSNPDTLAKFDPASLSQKELTPQQHEAQEQAMALVAHVMAFDYTRKKLQDEGIELPANPNLEAARAAVTEKFAADADSQIKILQWQLGAEPEPAKLTQLLDVIEQRAERSRK